MNGKLKSKSNLKNTAEKILNVKSGKSGGVRSKKNKSAAVFTSKLGAALTFMQSNIPDTYTENGALSFSTTMNPVLDFFQKSGAMRGESEKNIVTLFEKAYESNRELALRALFYMRDVRGGQGERRAFRAVLKWLGKNHDEDVINNLVNVPFFGRWDDLLVLLGTPVENEVVSLVNNQLMQDLEILDINKKEDGKNSISLCAKWLKSENTSSEESKKIARKIRKKLNISQKLYRKILSNLRAKLNIVEREMCFNNWGEIDYKSIPSRAQLLYRKAFRKHDAERYAAYIDSVVKGQTKINASTLYPHEMISRIRREGGSEEIQVLWDNMPDFTEGSESGNVLVVSDLSGSMTIKTGSISPIEASIGLGIYFAERNVGKFKNHIITFSRTPRFVQFEEGDNLIDKYNTLSRVGLYENTDLQAVFQLILNAAKEYKLPKKEMPKKVLIISDMQFNTCAKGTNLDGIKAQYNESKYKLPEIVFWNVNGTYKDTPARDKETGVALVSGYSPSILKFILAGKIVNPTEMMLDVLNDERYRLVQV